jgi:hypothetical protein
VNPSVCCYPIPEKRKAALTCEAFAAGVVRAGLRADVYRVPPRELGPGAAVFYGVRPCVRHLWEQAKREGRDWYYIDNSYFDVARERQFRVTKNAIQHTGQGRSDGRRFDALGLEVKPMRDSGSIILVCAQSAEFMSVVAGDPGWRERVTRNFERHYGDRVLVREKGCQRPLSEDLARARLLVTWSSAAAVMALLDGVRVMCAPECAATYANNRRRWASVLADNQWTIDELAAGRAWRGLNG